MFTSMNNTVFLLLGTNLGNLGDNLAAAIHLIGERVGNIMRVSSHYRTAAWGKTDQPEFCNQVIEVSTLSNPEEVLAQVLAIEALLGRERKERWAERLIDIDILYYNDRVVQSPGLIIPHPHLQNRRFTLVPLCEIAPAFVHPVLHKTNSELLEQCPDQLAVDKVEE
jgi:2-amino-4-hydroxy-6-hydroxymethyldihydropteridine diphosphokinase